MEGKISKVFDVKKMLKMKVGERYEISRGTGFTRVPTGWIYESWPDDETGICCFVPE